MSKRFDCEEEPNDFMEMPCMCDCGKWFDLNDGHASRNTNKVVCAECKEKEVKAERIREQIDELSEYPNKKREIKKIKQALIELE